MSPKFPVLISMLGSLAACVSANAPETAAPTVGSASDLSAFKGAKAGQAEMGIQNLGYELVRSEGLTSYWFNPSTAACAQIVTADGRYSSVKMLSSGGCE